MSLEPGLLISLAAAATAQVSLLTPREAVQVVQLVPEVAEARNQGYCPRYSVNYGDLRSEVSVQVRLGCGEYAGSWINSYLVHLRSGGIFQLESKQPISNPDGDVLAKSLLKQAGSRLLSVAEARCLALEAARNLPGWSGPEHTVTVEQSSPFRLQFKARLRTREPSVVTERLLSVDRSNARVLDEQTGFDVVSPSVMSLASKMLVLHTPLLLSEMDALEIARQVPEVRARQLEPCTTTYLGGPLSWEDISVSVRSHCEGAPETTRVFVAVDPTTGKVLDPDSRKPVGGPAAERAARGRLDSLVRQRSMIREEVDAVCSSRGIPLRE